MKNKEIHIKQHKINERKCDYCERKMNDGEYGIKKIYGMVFHGHKQCLDLLEIKVKILGKEIILK